MVNGQSTWSMVNQHGQWSINMVNGQSTWSMVNQHGQSIGTPLLKWPFLMILSLILKVIIKSQSSLVLEIPLCIF
jgi:hypothetical protein